MIKVFGIKNCDTMKKAFKWLDENHIEYSFHDYKKEGMDATLAKEWIEQLGWEKVINKKGTTWRKLSDQEKSDMNNENAITAIVSQPSMIKRPLVLSNNDIILGFKAEEYTSHFINE